MPKQPKHHFVPWSYLRYFATDSNASRKNSVIHMWDKEASIERIEKTDKVKCYVRGQNTVEELVDPEKYEKLYADSDAALGEIVRLLLQTTRQAPLGSSFNPKNKDVLAQHIMLLLKRQPTVLSDTLTKIDNIIDKADATLRLEYKDVLPTSVLDRVLASRSAKQYAIELSMTLNGSGFEALRNKVWVYCRNETGVPFITSDFPLCPQFIPSYSGGGMADPGCLLFFPVAPDVLIYMVDPIHYTPEEKEYFDNAIEPICNQDFVLIANYAQYSMCTRQIYSNKLLSPAIYTHPDVIENGIQTV
jgi:hypothetical protein